ncbi:TPA: hypothetical protein QCJ52_000799 [Enterobacter ludwigii]|uniref:hypothetical protein n=1 Tax=Enterobacter ludwigii TaxID=299767 RepID=UPI002FD423A8|nr:hypothetical protein [Enterobacter ludwigii]
MQKLTITQVIAKIENRLPNTFDYDGFVYNGLKVTSYLKCKKHGIKPIIIQSLFKEGNVFGCDECYAENYNNKIGLGTDKFISRSKSLYPDLFGYDRANYHNANTKLWLYCKACNKYFEVFPVAHYRSPNHEGCTLNRPIKQRTKSLKPTKASIMNKLVSDNKSNYNQNWEYANGWNEERLLDGNYAGFIYTFYFPKLDKIYYGSKQLYIKVKNKKKIKPSSKENGWREYTSSSTEVNELINSGEEYIKTIQYAFPLMSETLLVETSLITTLGLHPNCINKAIMNKCSVPNGERAYELYQIIKVLIEALR